MNYRMIGEMRSQNLKEISGGISTMHSSLAACDSIFKGSSDEYKAIMAELKKLADFTQELSRRKYVGFVGFNEIDCRLKNVVELAEKYLQDRAEIEKEVDVTSYRGKRIAAMHSIVTLAKDKIAFIGGILPTLPDGPVKIDSITIKLKDVEKSMENKSFDIHKYALWKTYSITIEKLEANPGMTITKGDVDAAVTNFINSSVSKMMSTELKGKVTDLRDMNRCFSFANAHAMDQISYEYYN